MALKIVQYLEKKLPELKKQEIENALNWMQIVFEKCGCSTQRLLTIPKSLCQWKVNRPMKCGSLIKNCRCFTPEHYSFSNQGGLIYDFTTNPPTVVDVSNSQFHVQKLFEFFYLVCAMLLTAEELPHKALLELASVLKQSEDQKESVPIVDVNNRSSVPQKQSEDRVPSAIQLTASQYAGFRKTLGVDNPLLHQVLQKVDVDIDAETKETETEAAVRSLFDDEARDDLRLSSDEESEDVPNSEDEAFIDDKPVENDTTYDVLAAEERKKIQLQAEEIRMKYQNMRDSATKTKVLKTLPQAKKRRPFKTLHANKPSKKPKLAIPPQSTSPGTHALVESAQVKPAQVPEVEPAESSATLSKSSSVENPVAKKRQSLKTQHANKPDLVTPSPQSTVPARVEPTAEPSATETAGDCLQRLHTTETVENPAVVFWKEKFLRSEANNKILLDSLSETFCFLGDFVSLHEGGQAPRNLPKLQLMAANLETAQKSVQFAIRTNSSINPPLWHGPSLKYLLSRIPQELRAELRNRGLFVDNKE